MTDLTAVLQAVQAIAARPVIPVQDDLWDSAHVGAYLKCCRRQVLERYAPRQDFPKAIRLPTPAGKRGDPRWPAREVIEWAEKHRERT